ncbi:FAD-dependent monooxygenase [bacterium]|nr:FAD-dependent monooxygenase [bacterium]MCI0602226.1 FAD-dependent monooxygenase [bacterium]
MDTDVLILGAGPAGAALSLLMARKGYSVEILDAAYFPRPKICGEFLNPQAVQWLRENELLAPVEALNPFPIRGMRITDHNGDTFKGTYQTGTGYAIQRKDFDALLISILKREGIQLHEGFRASQLMFDQDRVAGVLGEDSDGNVCEKRARVIVGADGRNNLIGRTFGWMKTIRFLRKYAFLSYFDDVDGLQNYGEIHLVKDGYVGVAPLSDRLANVALVVDEKVCPNGNSDLKAYLLSYLEQTELKKRLNKTEPLVPVITAGPLAFKLKRISGNGTILVGDTCGFIDPFTGEGINYAFLSASVATEVLDECFRKNRFDNSSLMVYDKKRHQILGRKFQMAHLLQRAIHSPFFSDFLVRRFARKQALADRMVSAVGSAIPVQEVWNFGFLLKVALGG